MKKIFHAFVLSLVATFGFSQDLQLGLGFFEGEPYLAVNPTDQKNIVVAWMHIAPAQRSIRTRASFDGGQTWSGTNDVQHLYDNYADPTMTFDNNGNLYLCFINHTGGATDTGGVYSIQSADGGLTWGNIQEAINMDSDGPHQPVDRPWLVCDRSNGPHAGNLYLTTKTVIGTPAPYRPYFVRSTDGAQSWENWRYMDTTNWLSGIPTAMVVPRVDANGILHGIYASYVTSQSPFPKYLMVSSSDGGTNFTYDEVVSFIPGAVGNDSAKLSWQMAANPADADHLALFFVQGQSGDLDILMSETVDGGINWSAVTRVNDDPVGNGKLQDLVWASFDNDGDLVVCWRDRRNSPGSGYARATEIYGAVKCKDSSQFSPNFTISDQAANHENILNEAGNDFMSHQVVDDTLCIAWGDTRTGFLNIWFDRIEVKTGNSVGLTSLAKEKIPFIEIYPNPANSAVKIDIADNILKKVVVVDAKGAIVYESTKNQFSTLNWESGIYFVRVEYEGGNQTLKLVKN